MYDPGVTGEIVTTGGNSLLLPTVNDTANTGAATTQGTTLTDDGSGDAVFGQKSLSAFSFATPWLRVSKELADDSILAIEALLGSLLGERLGRLANLKLTVGAGTTEPTGVVVGSGAGVTCVSTTAFTFDEVIDLVHKVDPAYRSNPGCAYMFSDPVLQSARKLKDGQGNYLWQHGNVQQGIPATLNGYNYHVNQAMSQAFTTGQKLMIFGDLSKYIVRKVGAPLIGALQDKDFWPGFGVAGWIRFDGNVMDSAAIKTLALA
jgi:HK97 family phage major capsid protein